MTAYEEERKMEYVTSIERRGIKKGRQQGLQEGSAEIVLLQLHRRFGALDEASHAHISALPVEQLQELSVALLDFSTLSDLENWLQRHPLPSTLSGVGENGAVAQREPGT